MTAGARNLTIAGLREDLKSVSAALAAARMEGDASEIEALERRAYQLSLAVGKSRAIHKRKGFRNDR